MGTLDIVKLKNRRGFTLIEIVITILIISILAVVLLVNFNNQKQKANETGVNVDMHSFYVAAKGTILSSQGNNLITKEGFITQLNTFLDPGMQIGKDGVYSAEQDPWKKNYEFRWRSREVNGQTEYWVAFLSKGVPLREGWIFEPDKPTGESMYSRKGIETFDYRYIMVLGYYDGGIIIPKMPNNVSDTPWIIGGTVPEVENWAYLSFAIEEDNIEYEEDKTSEQTLVETPEELNNGMQGGGVYKGEPALGWNNYIVHDIQLQHKSYSFIESMNNKPSDYTPSFPSNSVFYSWTVDVPAVPENGILSDADLDNWFASNNFETTTKEETNETGEKVYTVTINVGNGNIIQLTFREADKRANSTWFKVGSKVKMTAIPAKYYTFSYWKVDGVQTSTATSMEIVVNASTVFTAKFRMALKLSGGKLVNGAGTPIKEYIVTQQEKNQAALSNKLWDFTVQNNKATLTKYKGISGSAINLRVPSKMGRVPVVALTANNLSSTTFNSITIPAGTTIGSSAFYGVKAPTVTINDTCTLGYCAFESSVIDNLYIGKGAVIDEARNSPFMSATIKNVEVHTNIVEDLFRRTGVEKLIIGTEITSIGADAFDGCNITNVPAFTNISSIGTRAFYDALKCKTGDLTFKAGVKIGDSAFYSSSTDPLTFNSITIPAGTTIGSNAFSRVKAPTVTINDTCTFGYCAFESSKIDNLYIGKGAVIDAASRSPFLSATIKNVEVHTNIVEDLFRRTGVEKLIIGTEITSIGADAFNGCNKLMSVKIHNTKGNVTIGTRAFYEVPATIEYVG